MSPKRIYGDAYVVLVSPDKKYTLVPEGSPIPGGWRATSRKGTKSDCIRYIKEVWTDMTAIEEQRLLR